MGFCKFTKSGRPASVSGDRESLSSRGVPQGHLLRGAQRRGNPFFSCKETDSHASDAVTGVGMTGSGTSRTPSPTTAHRTHPQGAMPTHRPAGQMRILRRDTWVPPYRVRRSCRTGRRDAVPYNGSSHPSAGGRCPHIAPSDKCAFCGGTHGSRPTGYAGHAGRDVGTPSPTTAHRTHPQGAMSTHRPAGSTKRQAQAPASLCVMRLFTWRSWRPRDRRGRPSDSAP